MAKIKDELKEENIDRPQAINEEPISEGREYVTQEGTLQNMPAQDEDPNSRSANTFVCDSAVQKTFELQQMSQIYTYFDAFNREQANARAKMLPKKAPPPQLPKLTDTLPPSNAAVIQRNRRLAGIAKQTVILRPPQKPPQKQTMDTLPPENLVIVQSEGTAGQRRPQEPTGLAKTLGYGPDPNATGLANMMFDPPAKVSGVTTADVATSSYKPATINEEDVEMDAWLASFGGVTAAEESAPKATTRPLTFENLAAVTGERPTRSQGARSSRYTEDMGRK